MKKALIVFSLLFSSSLFAFDTSFLKEGDIIFQETSSDQGRAIKLATKSRYTHVGIIFRQRNQWKVFEAVQPVKVTNLRGFIARGIDGHYVIKRLKEQALLTTVKVQQMKKNGKRFLGKNYDYGFHWSDDKMYCSELVYKIYERGLNVKLGQLKPLKSYDLSHPLVKKILKRRYGKNIPYDEPMISPESIFQSPLLVEVKRR